MAKCQILEDGSLNLSAPEPLPGRSVPTLCVYWQISSDTLCIYLISFNSFCVYWQISSDNICVYQQIIFDTRYVYWQISSDTYVFIGRAAPTPYVFIRKSVPTPNLFIDKDAFALQPNFMKLFLQKAPFQMSEVVLNTPLDIITFSYKYPVKGVRIFDVKIC